MGSNLWNFLYFLIYNAPLLLVYLVGIVLSIVFRKNMGKASVYAIIGFLLLMFSSILIIGAQAVFYFVLIPSGNYGYFNKVLWVINIIRAFLEIIGFILLFVALFSKRNATATGNPPVTNPSNFS